MSRLELPTVKSSLRGLGLTLTLTLTLLKADADVILASSEGNNVLHHCVEGENLDGLGLLLVHLAQAVRLHRNNAGQTPLELAEERKTSSDLARECWRLLSSS